MPDVRTQIADMMKAYDKYVKGKQTSAGVAESRAKETEVENAKREKATG